MSESARTALLRFDTLTVIQDERFWLLRRLELAEGRLVAVNGGPREVLVFDIPSGHMSYMFGRHGEGPGEFGYITDVHTEGDSIHVLDSLYKRFSLFVRGQLVETIPFVELSGDAQQIVRLDDGRVVISLDRRSENGEPPGPSFSRNTVMLAARVEDPVPRWQELFAVPGVERMVLFVGQYTMPSLPSFRDDLSYGLTAAGVFGAEHRSGWIGMWDWNGRVLQVRDSAETSVLVSPRELEMWHEAVERRIVQLGQTGEAARLERERARAGIDRWNGRIPRPVVEDLVTDGRIMAVRPTSLATSTTGTGQYLIGAGV